MPINTAEEKFIHELGDIYDAEHRFLDAQNEMLPLASDNKLKKLLEQHIKQTEGQIQNLEKAFEHLGEKAKRHKCDAAAGLVSEGQKSIKEAGTDQIRDCLIASSQAKVEHYEIASYRGLMVGAKQMGQKEVLELLQQNLTQEEQTAEQVEKSAPQLLKQTLKEQEKGK